MGVFRTDHESADLGVFAIFSILLFLSFLFCFGVLIGVIEGLQFCIAATILLLAYIKFYICQSDNGRLIRQVSEMELAAVKRMYLEFNDQNIRKKRILEEIFHKIAINKGIHPALRVTYKPVIKTTIDLSDNRIFTEMRDLQRQMRIDAIFATTSIDHQKIKDLLDSYAD